MSDITFAPVTMNCDKLDAIRKIYEEAFPENEREATIDSFIQVSEETGVLGVYSANEGDKLVGMLVMFEAEKHIYLQFLAVNSELRGGGYGTKIMQALMRYAGDKLLLFDIETPMPDAENYEQRVKRERFYEKVGCVKAGIDFDYGGDNYRFFCNRITPDIKSELRKHFESCVELIRKYDCSGSMLDLGQVNAFLDAIFG